MTATAVECVIFKPKPGVAQDAFLAAVRETNRFLQRMDGFIRREVSLSQSGDTWLDVVHWSDLAAAERASAAFLQAPECRGFMMMLDPEQMTMLHLRPVLDHSCS